MVGDSRPPAAYHLHPIVLRHTLRGVDSLFEITGQTCGTCRFWRQDAADARGPGWGQCRRMPPVMPAFEAEKLVHVGVWPHTAADDWCGEWGAANPAPSPP